MASASVNFRALAWLCVLALINLTKCDRVKNKIYQDIQGDMACFKRFNGTQEIGCTSKFHGNSGVIHVVKNESDLSWVFDKGPHQPYVLALSPQFLTPEVLEQAKQSGKVSGVVVMVQENLNPGSVLVSGFSGESHCPNEELGLYNSTYPIYANYCQKKPWNPKGSSLLYMSWNFPIFLLNNQTSIDYITEYYEEFNKPGTNGEPRSWPLLCMELKSNMFGTTNTEVCMRRRSLASSFVQPVNFCDPLSDSNIWGTLKPMNSSNQIPEKSVTIVATRMDAASMFDNISPGANSAISGLVTLMVAADALNKYKDADVEDSPKNVLFVIYQGESWGYIGSSRMVWDMERGEFPFKPQKDEVDQMSQINLTHIEQFIEIEQVGQGMQPDGSYLFFHTDPISNSDPQINDATEKLLTLLETSSVNITFDKAGNNPLPPASFQSFLKKVHMSGVLITDHKEGFKNNFYESIFDDAQNVKYNYTEDNSNKYPKHISNVASTLATALYTHITGNSKTIPVNETLTNSLFHCYMQNVSCPMFRTYGELVPKSFFEDKPAKMYVSVKGGEDMRTYITKSIFATLLGDQVPLNKSLCKIESFYHVTQLYYYSSIDNGTCYRSTVRQTEAMSPAFLIENYDWQSGEYSTWTESGWQMTKLMIYLKPSMGEEVGLLCGGIASLLLSFGVVYFFNSRANIIFAVTTPPVAC